MLSSWPWAVRRMQISASWRVSQSHLAALRVHPQRKQSASAVAAYAEAYQWQNAAASVSHKAKVRCVELRCASLCVASRSPRLWRCFRRSRLKADFARPCTSLFASRPPQLSLASRPSMLLSVRPSALPHGLRSLQQSILSPQPWS